MQQQARGRLDPALERLLGRVKERLQASFGRRFRRAILYGSRATPVPVDVFERGEFAIYRAVKDEGIEL